MARPPEKTTSAPALPSARQWPVPGPKRPRGLPMAALPRPVLLLPELEGLQPAGTFPSRGTPLRQAPRLMGSRGQPQWGLLLPPRTLAPAPQLREAQPPQRVQALRPARPPRSPRRVQDRQARTRGRGFPLPRRPRPCRYSAHGQCHRWSGCPPHRQALRPVGLAASVQLPARHSLRLPQSYRRP